MFTKGSNANKARGRYGYTDLGEIIDSLTWYMVETTHLTRGEAHDEARRVLFGALDEINKRAPKPEPLRAWERGVK